MNTESNTSTGDATAVQGAAVQGAAPAKSTMSSITEFFGLTSSKPVDTKQTLEDERRRCIEDINARLEKLNTAPTIGGGLKRTKRSRRSKKTKRRRGKRSGKRTRR